VKGLTDDVDIIDDDIIDDGVEDDDMMDNVEDELFSAWPPVEYLFELTGAWTAEVDNEVWGGEGVVVTAAGTTLGDEPVVAATGGGGAWPLELLGRTRVLFMSANCGRVLNIYWQYKYILTRSSQSSYTINNKKQYCFFPIQYHFF